MCGLVGFIRGGVNLAHDKDYSDYGKQMLYADALRGLDATGLFTVETNRKAYWAKDAVEGRLFLDQKKTDTYLNTLARDTRVFAGHNRWATIGDKGYDGAHPHLTENVILVHNGTLRNYQQWTDKHDKSNVDSARLAQTLSNDEPGGIKTLERIEGAYAMCWYDLRNAKFYMARNKERPLFYLRTAKDLLFASEAGMMHWIARRTGVLVGDKYDLQAVPTNILHTWDMTQEGAVFSAIKPKIREYEEWKPIVYSPPSRPVKSITHINQGKKKAKEDTQNFTVPAKRANKTNTRLKKLGVQVQVGDVVEVCSGQFTAYSGKGGAGKLEGYFDDEWDEMMVDDAFQGQLWADVHQIPHWDTKTRIHDTVIAVVKGIAPAPKGNKEDITLMCQFKEFACHRDLYDVWGKDKHIGDFFERCRWRYNEKDSAAHQVGKHQMTNREFDLYVAGSSCEACEVPASMVPRDDMTMNEQGNIWWCKECVESLNEG